MVHAACVGAVLTLLANNEAHAHYDPSAEMREATIASITTDTINAEDDGPRGVATTLRVRLGQSRVLTAGEEAYSTRSYSACATKISRAEFWRNVVAIEVLASER
jgi:hypothetical protein